MIVCGHELNRDNVQDWSDKTLVQDKEALNSDIFNDIEEASILRDLIKVELWKRREEKLIEERAEKSRQFILGGSR